MVEAEFGIIISTIISAYSNTKLFDDPHSAETWFMFLKEYNFEDLMEAVNYHIETSKFPPTIAELREQVKLGYYRKAGRKIMGGLTVKRPEIECKPQEFDTYEEMYAARGSNYTMSELEHVLLKQAERLHKNESV